MNIIQFYTNPSKHCYFSAFEQPSLDFCPSGMIVSQKLVSDMYAPVKSALVKITQSVELIAGSSASYFDETVRLMKEVKERTIEAVMKNTVFASFLAISGFAIAMPVNAQTAIVAALYQNPVSPQTEVRYENAESNRNQIILAVNNTPEGIVFAENLIAKKSFDRIVNLNQANGLVCMVKGTGSVDGEVMCGFIDYE